MFSNGVGIVLHGGLTKDIGYSLYPETSRVHYTLSLRSSECLYSHETCE